MKYLVIIISLIASANSVFAQASITIKVPEVKEIRSVDTLMEKAIKDAPNNKFYIEITIIKSPGRYEFKVVGVPNDQSIINLGYNNPRDLEHILKYKDNLCFFIYNGHTVFVDGPNDPYNLFIKTTRTKDFNFVDKPHSISSGYPRPFFHNTYNYAGNRFTAIPLQID